MENKKFMTAGARFSILSAVCGVVVAVLSCDVRSAHDSADAHSVHDPVADLKLCASRLEAYYNIKHEGDDADSTKRVSDVSYDVQKTDSLVSPYAGYIEYTVIARFGSGDPHEGDERIELVYQENRWVVKRHLYRPVLLHGSVGPWVDLTVESARFALGTD